jgi:phosphohistidine phosphatase
MRRLILLRHAKSDWPEGVPDEERPLGPRGRAAAPRMGTYLAAEGLVPDRAIVSPARRTAETWELAGAKLQRDGAVIEAVTDGRIYAASARALLDVVREQPDAAGTVLLVGHNPGIHDLARRLSGEGEREAVARLTTKYPTAALAVLDFRSDAWATCGWGGARLERFVTPKQLGGVDED